MSQTNKASVSKATALDHALRKSFRQVVTPRKMKATGALIDVVFGNLADLRGIPIVIPINQSFDFEQRARQSVLGAFEYVQVGSTPFFDYLDTIWPAGKRPDAAGLGTVKHVKLPDNTLGTPHVIFVVTTRNSGPGNEHYGLYVNTPIEAVNIALESVMAEAERLRLSSVALPLLGAGFANIQRPVAKAKLKQAITFLTFQKVEAELSEKSSPLRRAVITIYSPEPYSKEEHELWEVLATFLSKSPQDREQQIEALSRELKDEEAAAATGNPGLRAVSSAAKLWRERMAFLQEQQAITSDPAQKFSIMKQIEEAKAKIKESGG